MTLPFKALLLAGLSLAATAPLFAQEAAASVQAQTAQAAEDLEENGEITVIGLRERGTVAGDISPELQLGPQDIRAYGAGSLADLLTELAPQLRSGRGRGGGQPVVLVNGLRVSGFAEIRNLPPEALLRVDILPEEVALKYGYRADQRVINFVLRERFKALTGEAEVSGPTAGGRTGMELEANFLRLRNGTRLSLEGEYERQSMLLESQRSILTPAPSQPFSLGGNLTAADGSSEIDPALSALLGQPITLVAVPAIAPDAVPSLTDFASGAPNAASVSDLAPYRSLLPRTERVSLGATYNRSIFGVSATLTGRFETTDSLARLGLPGVVLAVPPASPFSPFTADTLLYRYAEENGPLLRKDEQTTARVGMVFNGELAAWRWSLNANYDRAVTNTLTDRSLDVVASQAKLTGLDPSFNPFGATALSGTLLQDRARSASDVAEVEAVFNGSLLALPAGALATSFKAGFESREQSSRSQRGGLAQSVELARRQGRFQANFDLPLTSVRNDVLAVLGDLSANFNYGVDTLSDFGTLTTLGYGLNWQPREAIRLIFSLTDEDAAPSIQQLGNPLVVTPNVRVFDFVRGETVDISRLDGGNAGLSADNRRVIKLGLTLKPFEKPDITLTANFIDSRTEGPIASFPTATAEIEAAFPDRFLRDADGRLVQIDNRPVNFARSDRQELRWGINFFQTIKASAAEVAAATARREAFAARRRTEQAAAGTTPAAPGATPAAGDAPPPGARRPGGGPGGGGGGGRFGGGPGGDGRLSFSLFHTWHFKDQILIREGVPVLDLLNGSATGSSGGQPRHEVEAQLGVNKSGLGARLSLDWRAGTTVRADPANPAAATGDLFFSDLATLNLRLFADLGQQRSLVQKLPWLRGTRVRLELNNLTNARLDVRDSTGAVPIGYQRDRLDPIGRSVSVQFRKLFF